MAPISKVATNIITGVLGAGKTTAIQSLIDQKPAGERWAIVINEYGQVAIDNALLEPSADLEIMELANGCVCCTLSYAFEPLLAQLIRRVKPHRLIVEPSGAGHPTRIIDMLRSENFASVLDLRATLCLVDPADVDNPRVDQSSLFNDQLHMSDSVVISWTDKRSSQLVEACRQRIAKLEPRKLQVYETAHGRLQLDWLELPRSSMIVSKYDPLHSPVPSLFDRSTNQVEQGELVDGTKEIQYSLPQLSQVHQSSPADSHANSNQATEPELKIGLGEKPRRFQNQGHGTWACGWIFSPSVCFNQDQLLDSLDEISPVLRLKGIFHCQDDWLAINRKQNESSVVPSSYRSDSRLEIIADQPLDWDSIEAKLIASIMTSSVNQ